MILSMFLQAADAELQAAEDEQVQAHDTHVQTLDKLVEAQTERIATTVLKYGEDRKVGSLCLILLHAQR